MNKQLRPRVLISGCLTGLKVRYDGSHKESRWIIDELTKNFDIVPVCPEMLAGMPAPRPTIDLHIDNLLDLNSIEAFNRVNHSINPTKAIIAVADKFSFSNEPVHGFVGVSRSPSCAKQSAKVYLNNSLLRSNGAGLFVSSMTRNLPNLPVIEDEQLQYPEQLDLFIASVIRYFGTN
ncbi:MAG: DUF523 domain-containing protein [Hahellaceae bacterium]|nr:DUF523 domain-containing protein [Hahellaceae bacterium]